MNNINKKLHDFEPTDSQSHSMECTKCAKMINIHEGNDWDKGLKEECSKA